MGRWDGWMGMRRGFLQCRSFPCFPPPPDLVAFCTPLCLSVFGSWSLQPCLRRARWHRCGDDVFLESYKVYGTTLVSAHLVSDSKLPLYRPVLMQ